MSLNIIDNKRMMKMSTGTFMSFIKRSFCDEGQLYDSSLLRREYFLTIHTKSDRSKKERKLKPYFVYNCSLWQ
jgi:hypothetical protein